MTNGELINLLIEEAKAYRSNCLKNLKANTHMHNLTKHEMNQEEIDAVLTGFINNIGYNRCLDVALYTKDLRS